MGARRTIAAALLVALGACKGGDDADGKKRRPAPVEVAPIARESITRARTYSGSLGAPAELIVAAKIAGRIKTMPVDLGDTVKSGQVVVELDTDERVLLLAQADAEFAVARATLVEANQALELTKRDLDRIVQLEKRGVSSKAQLDTARANEIARAASVEVARAQVARAEASRDAAKVRLGFTRIGVRWDGDDTRVVARRLVDEGAMVAANEPLLTIVELDPLEAVVFVSERDYAYLEPEQPVTLRTDAYPKERFEGRVARIAPVFETGSRQARVEIAIPNADGRLKPGMFVRATIDLETVGDAVVVPIEALSSRDDAPGVFLVDGEKVAWRPVKLGVRAWDRVQLVEGPTTGRVVTLGHQLLDDGSPIAIAGSRPE